MEVIRKELNPAQLYSTKFRYNPTTDTVEVTPDGGTTWVPAPDEFDPRHQTEYTARPTDDTACDAAASMVAHMQKILEQVIVGATGAATSVVTSILLLFFGTFALLFAAIGVIVGYLIGLGIEDLTTMAEGTDWAKLRCILYNALDSDGVLTAEGLQIVRAAVDAQITGVNNTIVHYLLDITGEGGLNYAASEGVENEAGDCTTCPSTWCVELTPGNWTDYVYGKRYYTNGGVTSGVPTMTALALGQVVSGTWRSTVVATGSSVGALDIEFELHIPEQSPLTRIGITGTGGGIQAATLEIDDVLSVNFLAGGSSAWTGSLTGFHRFRVQQYTNPISTHQLNHIDLSGTGLNPTGVADNC